MALVVQFLTSLRQFVVDHDEDRLRDWLRVEPPVPDVYHRLAAELRARFPPRHGDGLQKTVDDCLPEEDDVAEGKASPWPGLNSFVREYLEYWRDVDWDDPARLYAQLSDLLNSCANALANPSYGVLLLKTSMSLSESLSKLVMNLTRQPHLMARVKKVTTGDGERKSIVESAADIIQKIFTSCLSDRSSTRWTQPKGKKVGVYIFANLVLRLLFTCGKSRLAVQMFTNLSNMGPALALYPASQRVTYLYYLGRFYFDCNHFTRAHACFDEAYRQCPPRFRKHRRLIVTYWIPTNLLLARFPSAALLARPEAAPLGPVFLPVCHALRKGNFLQFHQTLAAHQAWLWDRGLYLTLLYRLRPLVWRSFTRRTFLLTYTAPRDPHSHHHHSSSSSTANDNAPRAAPILDLDDVAVAASYVQKRLEGYLPVKPPPRQRPPHVNSLFLRAVTNNTDAAAAAGAAGDGTPAATAAATTLVPPPGGPRRLRPSEGLLCGNLPVDTAAVAEGVVAPLVAAGLLNGFVAHSQRKFAIEGSKRAGGNAVLAGWPNPFRAIVSRLAEEAAHGAGGADEGLGGGGEGAVDVWEVPAWVKGP